MLTVTVLVGNPKPNSRTLQVAQALAERLVPAATPEVIDLATVSARLFDWPSDEMAALTERVAASDLLVVASPTYKATYTGLLDAGLFFLAYMRDPAQFVALQNVLGAHDALNEYISHTSSAVFACPPGVRPGDPADHWGRALLA